MTDPILFGFGLPTSALKDDPMEYSNHYLVGGNPDDPEHGLWDTEEQAYIAFASQFAEIAQQAHGNYLFIRRSPEMRNERIADEVKWRMIGRFSIAKLKEKNA